MKNIVMAVASVALAITLVGCGEKTTEEKIGDGLTKDLTSAKSAAADAAKAVDKTGQDAAKAVEEATK